ncbi:MAG: T9SS type A sorting domain-containing protein [Chlorobiota bacterium]
MIKIICVIIFCFPCLTISQHWEVYNTENTVLTSTTFSEIVVDDNNVTWIGTGDGLAKLENGELSLYNSSNSILPTQQVTDLFLDKSNLIWILYGDRIYRGRNGNFELYKSDLGGKTIAVDDFGFLYLGINTRVIRVSNDKQDTVYENEEFDNVPIKSLVYDDDGNVWFIKEGSWGQATRINTQTLEVRDSFSFDNDMSGNSLIRRDREKNIWLTGSDGELFKFDKNTETWNSYSEKFEIDFRSPNIIQALAFNNENEIHFTTLGISDVPKYYYLKNNIIKEESIDSLYPSDTFGKIQNNMAIDKNGNVFITAPEVGIFKLNSNTTSVNESTDKDINIFPNPAQNKLHIDTGDIIVNSISVSDILGNELIDIDYNHNNPNTLDISTLATGTYFINLMFDDGSSTIKKFVKE